MLMLRSPLVWENVESLNPELCEDYRARSRCGLVQKEICCPWNQMILDHLDWNRIVLIIIAELGSKSYDLLYPLVILSDPDLWTWDKMITSPQAFRPKTDGPFPFFAGTCGTRKYKECMKGVKLVTCITKTGLNGWEKVKKERERERERDRERGAQWIIWIPSAVVACSS